MKLTNKRFNIDIVIFIFPIMILLGKIIRWTILKSVLVDMSIGNEMINNILYGTGFFTSFSEKGMSDAVGNSAVFFRMINFFKLTTTTEFEIFISIMWNIILFYLIAKCEKHMTLLQFLFLITSVAVLNIWDFCLAKEPLQMMFFIVMYAIICSNKLTEKQKYIGILAVLMICIVYYRVYYILIIAFLIIVSVICKKWLLKLNKIKKIDIILLLIILVLCYFIMLSSIKIIDTESFNELIRVRTRLGDAKTQMLNIFKTDNLIIFSVDYLIMILRMLFPLELIPMGIKYWAYVFYQILLSYFLIKNISTIKVNSKSQNIALYLYMAFILASGTFEPDFGSWVRHEAAIIPILLIITNLKKPKEKDYIDNLKEDILIEKKKEV